MKDLLEDGRTVVHENIQTWLTGRLPHSNFVHKCSGSRTHVANMLPLWWCSKSPNTPLAVQARFFSKFSPGEQASPWPCFNGIERQQWEESFQELFYTWDHQTQTSMSFSLDLHHEKTQDLQRKWLGKGAAPNSRLESLKTCWRFGLHRQNAHTSTVATYSV